MFIEFQVGNFRSFRDIEKFTMLASPKRPNDHGLEENNVFTAEGLRFLKTKAIYGANASGKSNFIHAIGAFCNIIDKSVSNENILKSIWSSRFYLISDWEEQPIFFQYTFMFNNSVYRYGFEVLKEAIHYEWLFKTEEDKEIELFIRKNQELIIDYEKFPGSKIFANLKIDNDNELFRINSLFLNAAALYGNKLASSLRKSLNFIAVINGLNDEATTEFAMDLLENGHDTEKLAVKKFIQSADIGIEDLGIEEIPEEVYRTLKKNETSSNYNLKKPQMLFSTHAVYDEDGKFIKKINVPFQQWESQGTSKLFGIAALVITSISAGSILIIDEFDARLHPNLTLKIVNLFNNKKTNPNNAQLIFVTHDTGLLRRAELRRDQIVLVNKDKYGLSVMHSLIEYKGVRKDSSYEKEYLNGSYSAIPFLDDLDNVITNSIKAHGLQKAE